MSDTQTHRYEALASAIMRAPPCCMQFSPVHPDLLVVGTYNLLESSDKGTEPETAQRDGALYVLRVANDKLTLLTTVPSFSSPDLQSSQSTGGILDIHFHNSFLAAATSNGCITVYRLEETAIKHTQTLRVADASTVITSLAIDPSYPESRIALTTAAGEVFVFSKDGVLGDDANPSDWSNACEVEETDIRGTLQSVAQHTQEAWITAFSPPSWGDLMIFSGGDDALLLAHSQSSGSREWRTVLRDRKTHAAGVTCILPLEAVGRTDQSRDRFVLTGSYDDRLRFLQLGSSLVPKCLGEINLGGGVWRIRLLAQMYGRETVRMRMAVAVMYAGAVVVDLTMVQGEDAEGGMRWRCEFGLVGRFEGHESMCYGIDTDGRVGREEESRYTVVSCSFYDRRLCMWKVDRMSHDAGTSRVQGDDDESNVESN